MKIRKLINTEYLYTYQNSDQISAQTGLIGCLKAYFGNETQFYTTWNKPNENVKVDNFKAEFDNVINSLRKEGGFLSSRSTMSRFCRSTDKVYDYNTGNDFGVRVDTEDYSYLMRLNPAVSAGAGDFNLYCYCYKKDWLDSHLKNAAKGIRFITPSYDEKFRIADGDELRIVYPNGETKDKVCRYIDDYHFEADYLYHICEFAEQTKRGECKVIPLRSSLPDMCYVFVESVNKVGIVHKGAMGYTPANVVCSVDSSENRKLVEMKNVCNGVTKAQAEAMKAGSMFGWDTPAADPSNYNEDGTPIKSKKQS